MGDAEPANEKAAARAEAAETGENPSAKLAGLSDQLLRLHAEFDNYKKRTAKEKEQLAHSSEAKMMLRMLPIYEEISLAEKEVAALPDGEVKKGVQMVLSKLRQSFEKEGLKEMKLEGEKFDPFRHDCAMKEESGLPEGTIMNVIKKGYLFKGEVLRHAIVSISGGKKKDEAKAGKPEENTEKEGGK